MSTYLRSTSGSSSQITVSQPLIKNILDKNLVQTGFLIGTAQSDISTVEISLDSGSYSPATGTSSWKFQFPAGSSTWRDGTSHTISIRGKDSSGNTSSVKTISVRKGQNKDINGDGYGDFAIGENVSTNGTVYIFLSNGSTGISSGTLTASVSATRIITGVAAGNQFGQSVALGDINGDGYSDLVVGAGPASGGQGHVYIFHSTGTGGITVTAAGSADRTIVGTVASDFLGATVATGDINGDGYADVASGANGVTNGVANSGNVYIFHSSGSAGVSITTAATASRIITGPAGIAGKFGETGVAIGDINGDGYADLIGGAASTTNGTVYVFYSSGSAGISITAVASASVTINGVSAGDKFGKSSAIGDINGDGFFDVVCGANARNAGMGAQQGTVYIYHSNGSSGITSGVYAANSNVYAIIAGAASNTNFGFSVALGDINGDGYADLSTGAESTAGAIGAAFVFNSSGSSGISVSSASSANATINGVTANDHFGNASAMADFNGDGYMDLIESAYRTAFSQGQVYIINSNGSTGVNSGTYSASTSNTIILGPASVSEFGHSISFNGFRDLFKQICALCDI